MLETVVNAIPGLREVFEANNLGEYWKKQTDHNLDLNKIDTQIMLTSIGRETARLYGEKVALEVVEQIKCHPVVESGTHMSFVRDIDNRFTHAQKMPNLRSQLNQNVLISASLINSMGYKYNVGLFGSQVSLDHASSGGFVQVGKSLFPSLKKKKLLSNSMLYGVNKSEFNFEAMKKVAKLDLLNSYLEKIEEKSVPREVLENILYPYNNDIFSYEISYVNYLNLSDKKREMLDNVMYSRYEYIKDKMGLNFGDIDKEMEVYESILCREDLDLTDKVALCQSSDLSKVFSAIDMQHVSVDVTNVTKNYIVDSLKN